MIAWVECVTTAEIESLSGSPDCAVISITSLNGRLARIPRGFSGVLRLAFDDLDHDAAGIAWTSGRFDSMMARETLYFMWKINRIPLIRGLLCECEDGLSRSGPIARFAAHLYGAELRCRRPINVRDSHVYQTLACVSQIRETVPARQFGAPSQL